MITPAEVVALLEAACPDFASSPEHGQLHGDEGRYGWVVQLVFFLLRRLGEGDPAPLQQAMDVAERVLAHGDLEARTLVDFGLIEDLTNRNLWPAGVSTKNLLAHFGPQARDTGWVRALCE